jgi:hypothetical protein
MIDVNDWQCENDSLSIRVSFDRDSKVTDESSLHHPKHLAQTASTDAGMQIDAKLEHPQNASVPINNRFDTDSKVTDRRFQH